MAQMNPLKRCDAYGWTALDNAIAWTTSASKFAMGFKGDGNYIDGVVVRMKPGAACTATARALIYNTYTGTWGTNAVPSGTPVATGDTVTITDIWYSESNTGYEYLRFPFSTKYQSTDDENLILVIELVSGDPDTAMVSVDQTSPTSPGNAATYSGSWSSQAWDYVFAVLSTESSGTHTSPIIVGPGAVDFGTGDITPGIPSGNTGDLLLLVCETTYGNTVAAPTGWTEKTSFSPLENSSGTSLFLFYRVATGSEGSTVTVADPGDHVIGQVFRFRNVNQPYRLFAGESATVQTASQSAATQSLPSVLATVPEDSMFVGVVGVGVDTEAEDWFTAMAWNANCLSGPGHMIGNQTTRASGGGGFCVATMTWASEDSLTGTFWVSFTSSQAWNGFIIVLSARSSASSTPSKLALTWTVNTPTVSTPPILEFREKGTNATGSTGYSITPSYPSGWQTGDLLIAYIHTNDVDCIDTVPSGWSLLGTEGTYYWRALYYRVAQSGDDTTPTWGTDAETEYVAFISAWKTGGFSTSAPIEDVGNITYTTLNTTIRGGDVDVDEVGTHLIFIGVVTSSTDYQFTPPTNPVQFTEQHESHETALPNYDLNIEIADAQWTTGNGNSGYVDATVDNGTTSKHAFVIAVNPPWVVGGGVTATPAKVTATWAVNTPSVVTGGIHPVSKVSTTWSVGAAEAHTGTTFAVEKVTGSWSVNTATAVVGARVAATVLETQWAILAPTLMTGAIVPAAKVSTAWAVQTPEIQTGTTFAVAKVACAWTVQTANISLGARVSVDKVTGAWSVSTPSIFAGVAVTVTPSELSVQWTVKDTGITTGVVAEPGAVSVAWSVVTPTIVAQSGETVSAEKVSVTWSVKTHVVKTGAITIQGDVWKCQNRTNDRLMQHTGDFHGVYVTVPAGMKRITGVWWKSVWAIAEGTVAMQVLDRSTKTVLATRTLPPCSAGVWRFTPLDYAVSETDTIYVGMKALADVNIGFSYYSGNTHPGFEVRNDPSNAIDWTESSSSWEVGNFNLCFEKSAEGTWDILAPVIETSVLVEPVKVSCTWGVLAPTIVATTGVVVGPTAIAATWSVGTPICGVVTLATPRGYIDIGSQYPLGGYMGLNVGYRYNQFIYADIDYLRTISVQVGPTGWTTGSVLCDIYEWPRGDAEPSLVVGSVELVGSSEGWHTTTVNEDLSGYDPGRWVLSIRQVPTLVSTPNLAYSNKGPYNGFTVHSGSSWNEPPEWLTAYRDIFMEIAYDGPLAVTVNPRWIASAKGGSFVGVSKLALTWTVQDATVQTGTRPEPGKVTTLWAVNTPTIIAGGGITVAPTAVGLTWSVGAPTIEAGVSAIVTPDAVSATWAIKSVELLTGVLTHVIASVSLTWSVQDVLVESGTVCQPAKVSCTWAVNAATTLTSALVQPAKVSGAWTVNTPAVVGGVVAVPDTVECTWTVPSVDVTTGLIAAVDKLACAWTAQAATVTTGCEISPAKLSATWAVNTVTVVTANMAIVDAPWWEFDAPASSSGAGIGNDVNDGLAQTIVFPLSGTTEGDNGYGTHSMSHLSGVGFKLTSAHGVEEGELSIRVYDEPFLTSPTVGLQGDLLQSVDSPATAAGEELYVPLDVDVPADCPGLTIAIIREEVGVDTVFFQYRYDYDSVPSGGCWNTSDGTQWSWRRPTEQEQADLSIRLEWSAPLPLAVEVQEPLAISGQTVPTSVLSTVWSVRAPTVSAGAITVSTSVSTTWSVGSVEVLLGSRQCPAATSVTWDVGAPSYITGAHFTPTKLSQTFTIGTSTVRVVGGETVWYKDNVETGVWTKDEAESGVWTEDEVESGSWTENPPGSH